MKPEFFRFFHIRTLQFLQKKILEISFSQPIKSYAFHSIFQKSKIKLIDFFKIVNVFNLILHSSKG